MLLMGDELRIEIRGKMDKYKVSVTRGDFHRSLVGTVLRKSPTILEAVVNGCHEHWSKVVIN